MSPVRVAVDRERCCAAGMCALVAPATFSQDDEDGRVVVLEERPPEGERASVAEAAAICPCGVISLLE
ncbi:ferredoxin [Actinoalloteichus sp. AHMU CJ021]|uniref:ferredoxin n=1 Tax=Actinoalloteichus sp. AHMU CJ021 TaxID=2072503 RepID=UPI0026B78C7F